MSAYVNRGRWVLTAADCNKHGVPLWWAGKIVTPCRLLTIKANLGAAT